MKNSISLNKITKLIYENGYDIITSSNMKAEQKFLQHGTISCYEHSIFVAYMSTWITLRFNVKVDMRSMIRGALLHDYFLYDWHVTDKSHRMHGFTHAQTALRNAERDFTLNIIEHDIISKHMFPLNHNIPRYKESVIVNFADKICTICEVMFSDSSDSIVKAVKERFSYGIY